MLKIRTMANSPYFPVTNANRFELIHHDNSTFPEHTVLLPKEMSHTLREFVHMENDVEYRFIPHFLGLGYWIEITSPYPKDLNVQAIISLETKLGVKFESADDFFKFISKTNAIIDCTENNPKVVYEEVR